jgi:hypothetical protein
MKIRDFHCKKWKTKFGFPKLKYCKTSGRRRYSTCTGNGMEEGTKEQETREETADM